MLKGQAPRRKSFVLVGRLGFFRRNLIVFRRMGGRGEGGVNHRLLRQVGLRELRDLERCGGHELIVRAPAN